MRGRLDDEIDDRVRGAEPSAVELLRRARRIGESMILRGEFDPS